LDICVAFYILLSLYHDFILTQSQKKKIGNMRKSYDFYKVLYYGNIRLLYLIR